MTQSSPVDSGGISPVDSNGISPADSNGISLADSSGISPVESVRRTPADLLDPLLWTTLNFLNFIFQWTPADSGGLNM